MNPGRAKRCVLKKFHVHAYAFIFIVYLIYAYVIFVYVFSLTYWDFFFWNLIVLVFTTIPSEMVEVMTEPDDSYEEA